MGYSLSMNAMLEMRRLSLLGAGMSVTCNFNVKSTSISITALVGLSVERILELMPKITEPYILPQECWQPEQSPNRRSTSPSTSSQATSDTESDRRARIPNLAVPGFTFVCLSLTHLFVVVREY